SSSALLAREDDRRLLGGGDSFKEASHFRIVRWRQHCSDHRETTAEVELSVFHFVCRLICSKRSLELDCIWHFIQHKTGRQLEADRLVVSMGGQHDRLLSPGRG